MNFFYYSNNAPDAKVILNRKSDSFNLDISDSLISFSTSNDINDINGNFNVTIDNTNDRYVDRFGYVKIKEMSSIEIFAKDASTLNNSESVQATFTTTQEGETISQLVNRVYKTDGSYLESANIQPNTQNYCNAIIEMNNLDISTDSTGAITSDTPLQGGTQLKIPGLVIEYKRIFFGVVTSITQNFNAGSPLTISISGKSLGYWLENSTINVNPAINEIAFLNLSLQVWANKFMNHNAFDIFKELISISTDDVLSIQDFNLGSSNSLEEEAIYGAQNDSLISLNGQTVKDAQGNVISQKLENLTAKREKQLNNLLDPDKGTLKTLETLNGQTTGWADKAKKYNELKNTFMQLNQNYLQKKAELRNQRNSNTISQSVYDNNNKVLDDQINLYKNNLDKANNDILNDPSYQFQYKQLEKELIATDKKLSQQIHGGRDLVLKRFGIKEHWQKIFSDIILEIANSSYLSQVQPFQWAFANHSNILDGEYMSKAQIAKTVSDSLFFEFYMDTNGHFILKPPFYNVGVPDNNPTYIIEEEDLISFSINDNIEGMLTRVDVTGDWVQAKAPYGSIFNVHQDLLLLRDYGFKARQLKSLIFLRTSQDCKYFGQAYMAKNNQETKNASVTILGRPDLRLGVACYLKPRDTVYYIKSISHDFNTGEGFRTTLNLTAGRKIVTGIKVNSQINTIDTSLAKDNSGFSTVVINQGDTVENYVLTSILNNQEESLQQLSLGNDTQSIDGGVQIIKNGYIITEAPNIAYVGMIVDNNSEVLTVINVNRFLKLSRPVVNEMTQKTLEGLGDSYEVNAIINFKKAFTDFGINLSIIPEGQTIDQYVGSFNSADIQTSSQKIKDIGEKFTLSASNQFITDRLLELGSQADEMLKNNKIDSDTINTINAESTIINQIMNDLDFAGNYRQITDSDGRELPVLLNYGRTISLEKTNTPISQALDKVNTAEMAKKVVANQKLSIPVELMTITPNGQKAIVGGENTSTGGGING